MAIKGAKISDVRKRLRELVDAESFIELWEFVNIEIEDWPKQISEFKNTLKDSYLEIKLEADTYNLKAERLKCLKDYIKISKRQIENLGEKESANIIFFKDDLIGFVDALESLYEVYRDLDQNEILIINDAESYSCSSSAPLMFFNYLLKGNGINALRDKFLLDEYEGQKDIEINNIYDYKILHDYVDGENVSTTITFVNNLDDILKDEANKLLITLHNNIGIIKDKRERENYLQIISIEIKNLFLCEFGSSKERYIEKVKVYLCYVVNKIVIEYEDYLGKSKNIFLAIDQKRFNQLQAKKRRQSYALNYIGNDPNDFIKQTFGFLKNKYIPAESYDLFLNAFNGRTSQNKLLKIRWLQRQAGAPNKYKLIHFFKSLVKKGLIEEDDTSLKYKLPIIFSDFNDNPINNIQNSFSQFPSEYNMDPAMNEFLAAL